MKALLLQMYVFFIFKVLFSVRLVSLKISELVLTNNVEITITPFIVQSVGWTHSVKFGKSVVENMGRLL